ncbi:MAG: hypothetical protein OEM38_12405 [Gammaproteobacteria bacterium]|nr:hypothetical protein [Gammaproteobacteria bacterium]
MQGLEPQHVQGKDVLTWFIQSFQLIHRRFFSYFTAVTLFFVSLFLISQAIHLVQHVFPPLLLLVTFLITSAFIFYFFIAGLVMISHCSDHSQHINMNNIVQYFLPEQKTFFKMTIIAISVGLFYWVVSMVFNPGSDIFAMSQTTISLITDNNTVLFYVFKTGAVFLYFLLLVMFSLRTFFSVPLVIFHNLNYSDAKQLSQKAIFKNIKVMAHVLLSWSFIFFISMVFTPFLAIIFMPLFATFGYVAYRHIFLGKSTNQKAEELQCIGVT